MPGLMHRIPGQDGRLALDAGFVAPITPTTNTDDDREEDGGGMVGRGRRQQQRDHSHRLPWCEMGR